MDTDTAALRVFERNSLVRFGDDFLVLFNSELLINIQRLGYLGQVVRMEEDALARCVFDAGIFGSRQRRRLCMPWKDQVDKALSSIGVTNWHSGSSSRDASKDVLRQTEIL